MRGSNGLKRNDSYDFKKPKENDLMLATGTLEVFHKKRDSMLRSSITMLDYINSP